MGPSDIESHTQEVESRSYIYASLTYILKLTQTGSKSSKWSLSLFLSSSANKISYSFPLTRDFNKHFHVRRFVWCVWSFYFVKEMGCSTPVKPLKKNSDGCPSNQFSAAAMTSASDKKWRPSNCFFSPGSPTGPDPENRVRDQDVSPGRPVSSALQVPDEPGHCRARTRPPLVSIRMSRSSWMMDPTRSRDMPSCSVIDLAEIRRSSKIPSYDTGK
jgi:hypothetical protein